MARGDYPSDKQDQYMLRFPDGMRDRLKAMAAENNRSLNAQIINMLEEGIRGDDAWQTSLHGASDDDLEHIDAEIALARSVGQQTGSPANVVLMARLLERTTKMQVEIDKKLETFLAIQSRNLPQIEPEPRLLPEDTEIDEE